MKSRLQLYHELMEEIRDENLEDIKEQMRRLFKGQTQFSRLSLDQVEQILEWLRTRRAHGPDVEYS